MDISVIVVTYNQEETIGRTLDSILAQQFDGEWEIVIGDDASTDDTRRICEEYAARFPDRIRYLRRVRNMGVVANYFDCIRQNRSKYLADCAGDDFWVDPSKLQREFDYLETHPQTTLVATDWLCCNPDGSNPRRMSERPEVKEIEVYDRGVVCAEIISGRLTPHLCSALYRRSVILEAISADPAMMVNSDYTCEDTQILLACGAAGRMAILPGVSLHYSIGGDSISRRRDIGRRFDHTLASTRQTLSLADYFKVPRSGFADWLDKRIDYLHALAFQSASSERAVRLAALMKEAALKGGLKSRVYTCLMRFPTLWKIALSIYRLNP